MAGSMLMVEHALLCTPVILALLSLVFIEFYQEVQISYLVLSTISQLQ